jgi:hypothetical protein
MSSEDLRPEDLDPLTAPSWPITVQTSPLDPQLVKPADGENLLQRTIPAPPDVDQILSGEYTGWVPIIRAGESMEAAKLRAEAAIDRIENDVVTENTSSQLVVDTAEGPRTTSEVLGSIGPERVVAAPVAPQVNTKSRIDYFVPDPDAVDSPADALELARQRIAQMREGLQKSVSNVTKSFDHPFFKPESQPINNPPVVHTRVLPVETETVEEKTEVQESLAQHISTEKITEEPITHYRVREQLVDEELNPKPQFSTDQIQVQDHSLELVIMRDEIKDLRARLDASQKLIEDLMHRITNLAELALKGRQN